MNHNDLTIDLSQYHGRRPMAMSREDFGKIQGDIIGNNFDGGARMYNKIEEGLNKDLENKVFVSREELARLRGIEALSNKYSPFDNRDYFNRSEPQRNEAPQRPAPTYSNDTREPYDPFSSINEDQTRDNMKFNGQPIEDKTDDFYTGLFSEDRKQTQQTRLEPEPSYNQTYEKPAPQQPTQDNQYIRDLYKASVASGKDPEEVVKYMGQLTPEEMLRAYDLLRSNKPAPRGNVLANSLAKYKNMHSPNKAVEPKPAPNPRINLQELPTPKYPIQFNQTIRSKSLFD